MCASQRMMADGFYEVATCTQLGFVGSHRGLLAELDGEGLIRGVVQNGHVNPNGGSVKLQKYKLHFKRKERYKFIFHTCYYYEILILMDMQLHDFEGVYGQHYG